MKKVLVCLIIFAANYSHALVMTGKVQDCDFSGKNAALCTYVTTVSLPTLIVQDATGEEVWNASDEQLLAQYQSELDGLSPIYYIKRYADMRNGGDIEAAKKEIKNNLEQIKSQE